MVRRLLGISAAFALAASTWVGGRVQAQQPAFRAPQFKVDPAWPKIPNNWVLG
jgi:hypothetical protein